MDIGSSPCNTSVLFSPTQLGGQDSRPGVCLGSNPSPGMPCMAIDRSLGISFFICKMGRVAGHLVQKE